MSVYVLDIFGSSLFFASAPILCVPFFRSLWFFGRWLQRTPKWVRMSQDVPRATSRRTFAIAKNVDAGLTKKRHEPSKHEGFCVTPPSLMEIRANTRMHACAMQWTPSLAEGQWGDLSNLKCANFADTYGAEDHALYNNRTK